MPFHAVDLTRVRTYPLPQRQSRVALENLVHPDAPVPAFENPDLARVAEAIAAARRAGRPVIFSIGAHVIKRGLGPLLIDLIERGMVTHLASNGAAAIHDFEIALQGSTSEDVLSSLADGSFGMAEETGSWMNRAIRAGARDGMGIGEALGRMIVEDVRFRYRDASVLAAAYRQGIPYTVHAAIGTDIIHQHPEADFGAIGWGSGQDFKIFCAAVCELEGGVFCNFGSAVIGPEVFLKAVSIARNLGNPLRVFTTANFDLVELGDYRAPIGDDRVDYYYRPRKNIVNRPVALGGQGFHITGDHRDTLPNLRQQVVTLLERAPAQAGVAARQPADPAAQLESFSPRAGALLRGLLAKAPELETCAGDLARAFRLLVYSFANSGTLFICGNGGSMADALHISGELTKSFRRKRPLPGALRGRLQAQVEGEPLADHLQMGLRAIPLGTNLALGSAVLNDNPLPTTGLAQELLALARPGDVLLGISTSGRARNVLNAAITARALGVEVIGLTGQGGGPLAQRADIAIRAPAQATADVQEQHIRLYHALCAMLEDHFFGDEA